jgi:hypothetical protein
MSARAAEQGEVTIRVEAIGQLFNSFDPSPFHEKHLDADAEDYVVGWAQEAPRDAALRIVIHLPREEAAKPEASALGKAFANYFEHRAQHFDRELRELFRIGWRALVIGLAVLTLCLAASQTLAPLIPNPTAGRVVEESLILVGWVANWRPIEIYLYDWWPIVRRKRLYRRIARAPVLVKAG